MLKLNIDVTAERENDFDIMATTASSDKNETEAAVKKGELTLVFKRSQTTEGIARIEKHLHKYL